MYFRTKKLALLTVMVALIVISAQGRQTAALAPCPVTDLAFLDDKNGWYTANCLSGPTLFMTTTDGMNWRQQHVDFEPTNLFRLSSAHGWAVGTPSGESERLFLYHSADGGSNWTLSSEIQEREGRSPRVVLDFVFVDNQEAWFVVLKSDGGRALLLTTDGGNTILEMEPAFTDDAAPRGVLASRRGDVWIFGNNLLLHKQPKGKRFVDVSHRLKALGSDFHLSSGSVTIDGVLWLVGQTFEGVVLNSRDGGKNWTIAYQSKHTNYFTSVSFPGMRRGCVVGSSQFLSCTTDSGKTWEQREVLPAPQKLQSTLFTKLLLFDSGRGWLLRNGGFLYATTDGGASWNTIDPQSQQGVSTSFEQLDRNR